jgi:hypothetical protein
MTILISLLPLPFLRVFKPFSRTNQGLFASPNPSVVLPSPGDPLLKVMLHYYLPYEAYQLVLSFMVFRRYSVLCPLVIGTTTNPRNFDHLPNAVPSLMFFHESVHHHQGSVCVKMTAAFFSISFASRNALTSFHRRVSSSSRGRPCLGKGGKPKPSAAVSTGVTCSR